MDVAPSGRGHHKRRKKGARAHFDRRKNDERRRQQAGKENSLPLADLVSIPLPNQWKVVSDPINVEYCQLKIDPDGVRHVAASVVVHADLSWNECLFQTSEGSSSM